MFTAGQRPLVLLLYAYLFERSSCEEQSGPLKMQHAMLLGCRLAGRK